eukprot:363322-Chlamydomonas_euryale.AAC.4
MSRAFHQEPAYTGRSTRNQPTQGVPPGTSLHTGAGIQPAAAGTAGRIKHGNKHPRNIARCLVAPAGRLSRRLEVGA